MQGVSVFVPKLDIPARVTAEPSREVHVETPSTGSTSRTDGGVVRNPGSVTARHPYVGDLTKRSRDPEGLTNRSVQSPRPLVHPLLAEVQVIDDDDKTLEDPGLMPPGVTSLLDSPISPRRSPKGKDPDIRFPKTELAAASLVVVPKEQPKTSAEVFPVHDAQINKAIKAEKTLLADKYNANGGDNDYRVLVDKVALDHVQLHANPGAVSKEQWMDHARGYAEIIEMMEDGRWTGEVVDGSKRAGEKYAGPTIKSNYTTYVPSIVQKVVTGICAVLGGTIAANVSIAASGAFLVATAVGVYMIPRWNAGAQSAAVAAQLQDGAPITPEVSSKQVFRLVEKKGAPGEYERKAVPLRPPVAVKRELVALRAVANVIKHEGVAAAITLLNERIEGRETRIADLYASKTNWRSKLSVATQARRTRLKEQIKAVKAQADATDDPVARAELEAALASSLHELALIKRTAQHQCMNGDEIDEIANKEDDINAMRALKDEIADENDKPNVWPKEALKVVQAEIDACEADLKVAKVMEQINYMPNQSNGRGERSGFNAVVSLVGLGKAVAEAVAAWTKPVTTAVAGTSVDQPQPQANPQPSSNPEPQPAPEPGPHAALSAAGEFPPNWTTLGLNLGSAAIQVGQVVRYAQNQGIQAGLDQLLKWGGQLEVFAETAAGDLFVKPNDPSSGIDLKRLDDLKRGWLKQRCAHMSEILQFDADDTLMFLFKDLTAGDPGPVKVSLEGNRKLAFTDVFLTADALMDAFKNCTSAAEREELLIQLLTARKGIEAVIKQPGVNLDDLAPVTLTNEQKDLLAQYTHLNKVSTEVKNGNVDAFFASELISDEAKQRFDGALRHAIHNNTHDGLTGFIPMMSADEAKRCAEANEWLAQVKGDVEKLSSANYHQFGQKVGQQFTHLILGSADPQLARAIGTLVGLVLKERSYDLAAAGALATLDTAAFLVSCVNVSLAYAYHRFIIEKNRQRDLAERLGVRSLPHTGTLQRGGYFSLPNPAYYTGNVTNFTRLVAKPLNDTAGASVRYEQQLSPLTMAFKQLWNAAPLNKWRTEDGKFTWGILHYFAGYFQKQGLDLEVKGDSLLNDVDVDIRIEEDRIRVEEAMQPHGHGTVPPEK